jgi:hypothetical protein
MKNAIILSLTVSLCFAGCALPGEPPAVTAAKRKEAVRGVLRFLSEPAPQLTLEQCIFPELRPNYSEYYGTTF